MININSASTTLQVTVLIPERLTGFGQQRRNYACTAQLGGSEIAVKALALALQADLEKMISKIREEAYRQGARDRAMKAKHFNGTMKTGLFRGGCA